MSDPAKLAHLAELELLVVQPGSGGLMKVGDIVRLNPTSIYAKHFGKKVRFLGRVSHIEVGTSYADHGRIRIEILMHLDYYLPVGSVESFTYHGWHKHLEVI